MTYPPRGRPADADRWLGEAKDLNPRRRHSGARAVTSGNSPDIWHTGDITSPSAGPGTYIYFDRVAGRRGRATFADCALTVLATVVSRPTQPSRHPRRGIQGAERGSAGATGYRRVLMDHPDIVLKSLSEEHGIIEMAEPSDWPRIGERLRIIPNHACVVSNLFDIVHLFGPDGTVETVPVAARGRVD